MQLCVFAKKLTLDPGRSNEADIQILKNPGMSDRAILDAALVVSYFNFVNRMVPGFGVETDEVEEVGGYKY